MAYIYKFKLNYEKGGEYMIKKLVNKFKMRNKKPANPGNVYIPGEFEVEERKKDVDDNEL